MPRIDILEKDLTRATGTVGTDIPYIPGFSNCVYNYVLTSDKVKSENKTYYIQNKDSNQGFSEAPAAITDVTKLYERSGAKTPIDPVLCTSVIQFESLFSKNPVKFKKAATKAGLNIAADSFDRSYIMAKELINAGMPVYYHALVIDGLEESGATVTVESFEKSGFYTKLNTYLKSEDISVSSLKDKGEYTIKYITSGGYPNFGSDTFESVYEAMVNVAKERGDCVALIEGAQNDTTLNPTDSNSFFNKLEQNTSFDGESGSFAAAFTPWSIYSLTKSIDKVSESWLPACFGYLADLAANIKVSPNWLAMAGTTRGLIPNIKKIYEPAGQKLSNVVANAYQPTKLIDGKRALNAITNIKPYGLCIWGNRTLKTIEEAGLTGTSFLNTRNMISDIKKVAYRVAKSLIYEQNNEILWLNFKSQVAPFLEQLKSGAGIADYKLLKLDTHYNGSSLGKEEFACAIRIIPVYAVESFEITVVVSDADVAVE